MPLERFGFTATETRVYTALLKSGAATGYGVARSAGLARANAYHALDSLVRRGAARRTATRPPRYIAVPSTVLVADLERAFRRNLVDLEQQLKQIATAQQAEAPADPETLSDAVPLLARAERCIANAKQELLIVLGPWCTALYPAIDRLAARKVAIRALALVGPGPRNAAVRTVSERDLVAYWGGRPLLMVADRITAVCGVFATDGSVAGISTSSPGIVPFLRHLLRRELASVSGAT